MRSLLRWCFLWCAFLLALPALAAEPSNGVEAARRTVADLESAWNRHDMAAYAALLHDDAEWVNVVGMYWRGKAQIMKAHIAFHETIFKDCRLEGRDLTVREVAPDTVTAVWTHQQDAYRSPSGTLHEKTLNRMTLVLTRHDGRWRISNVQNGWINERAEKSNPVNQP
ncbi:MAG: hypothetical protein DI603_18935 [Roseateles depolymerans]|uniref:SnoaL-like domain-containing protein n=1 Tax=Roseateles depolymerans TaxID=76731 RepID=A0A2W5DEC7_9BURK|nr:MAG: hypothetical protein DI603_18935 [Roseateles depolymerans]